MAAAREILTEEGYSAAVTLRGVARRVGVAAPSIYGHFPDPEAIVQAVVVATFDELDQAVAAATEGLTEPVERLLVGCEAYVTFGIEHVNLYRLLFERNRQLGGHRPEGREVEESDLQTGPFGRLVAGVEACIESGASTAPSGPMTALQLWVALHGLIVLRGAQYEMPWPARPVMERSLVLGIAHIAA